MSEKVSDQLKETYQQLLAEKPKGIQLTGRVKDALKAPAGRYPIACTDFAVEDSMEGIDGIEDSWIFTSRALRFGAGVAIDLSKIRAKGTINQDGLVASGPVSFAYFYSFAVEKLRKGGLYRNGATTLFLDYDHPDIMEFLTLPPQELPWAKRAVYINNNLLNAPKEVLDTLCLKVSEGTVWLAKKQWDKNSERLYSNVCLAGDTLVVTKQGHVPIRELVGKIVEIWNGQAWVSTDTFTMTSELEPLIEIKLHNGKSIKATQYHKFPMADGTNKRAFELKKQDVIASHNVKPDDDKSERVETNTEIISIRPSPPEPVYCCNIESTGTFALSCGVLTRNCLEVLLKHRATCMLLPVNLGALELEEIPEQMVEGMRYLCKLHGLSRADESGIYLSPAEDKQVGLGVIGLANLLARYKVKYADFVGALEYLLEIDTEVKVDQALPFRLARSIIKGYYDAAEVAREFQMERCVTGDTWVMTEEGARQVKELVGKPFIAKVNGELHSTTEQGFWSNGLKDCVHLKTKEGYSLELTSNHKVLKATTKFSEVTTCVKCDSNKLKKGGISKTGKPKHICNSCGAQFYNPLVTAFSWVEAGNLVTDDLICLNTHKQAPQWLGYGDKKLGWLLGQVLGNGTLSTRNDGKSDYARVQFWGEYGSEQLKKAISYLYDLGLERGKSEITGTLNQKPRVETTYVRSVGLAEQASKLDMKPGHKVITEKIEACSSEFYLGFLQGLFDADGTVNLGSKTGSGRKVTLNQANIDTLYAVQRMLLRLGIASKVYESWNAGKYSSVIDGRTVQSSNNHSLNISKDNITQFSTLIGFSKPDKREKLNSLVASYSKGTDKEPFLATVSEIVPSGYKEVFDVTVHDVHEFDANGLRAHNCFAVAPTASVAFNGRDADGYTTAPEISPPLERSVDRDSDRFGVQTYEYHPDTEVAREVGWSVQSRLLVAWQVMMENTGLAHAISANIWDECVIDEAFLKWFLLSPLKTTYYRMQINQSALNKSEIITPDNINGDTGEDEVTMGVACDPFSDPAYCESCGG